MGIDQLTVIDGVGMDRISGDVTALLVDAREWDEEAQHLLDLQEKLNNYLSYFESGQVYEQFPSAEGKKCSLGVKVAFLYEPTKTAKEFLRIANDVLTDAGYRLEWTVGRGEPENNSGP